MKITKATTTIITFMVLSELKLTGKKKTALDNLVSNQELLMNEITVNCIIKDNLPVITIMSNLLNGINSIIKKYVGNLTNAELEQLIKLFDVNFNKQLYIVLDDTNIEM